jgi:hypothetical protein
MTFNWLQDVTSQQIVLSYPPLWERIPHSIKIFNKKEQFEHSHSDRGGVSCAGWPPTPVCLLWLKTDSSSECRCRSIRDSCDAALTPCSACAFLHCAMGHWIFHSLSFSKYIANYCRKGSHLTMPSDQGWKTFPSFRLLTGVVQPLSTSFIPLLRQNFAKHVARVLWIPLYCQMHKGLQTTDW